MIRPGFKSPDTIGGETIRDPPPPAAREWLIYSREHNQWWKPGEAGYTDSELTAGRYTYGEAVRIVRDANRALADRGVDEFMYLAPEILAVRAVVVAENQRPKC